MVKRPSDPGWPLHNAGSPEDLNRALRSFFSSCEDAFSYALGNQNVCGHLLLISLQFLYWIACAELYASLGLGKFNDTFCQNLIGVHKDSSIVLLPNFPCFEQCVRRGGRVIWTLASSRVWGNQLCKWTTIERSAKIKGTSAVIEGMR